MILKPCKAVNKTWFSNKMNRQNKVRLFSSNTQRGTEMRKGKMTPKREKTESLQESGLCQNSALSDENMPVGINPSLTITKGSAYRQKQT